MTPAVSNRDAYLPPNEARGLTLGRDACGSWDVASRHEWLVTNGLGGFACGTAAGANTRRYHGFLVASLKAPVERTMLVAKIEVSAHYLGLETDLSANEFAGGTQSAQGYLHLESFAVEDGIPTWRYAIADALLEQRIFMAPGANTSYLRLELLRATQPLRVTLKPLVTYRERGLDALEDLLMPGTFVADLSLERPVYLVATAEAAAPAPGTDVLEALAAASQRLIAPLPKTAPAWIRALAQASDQFIVRRSMTGGAPGRAPVGAATSIIAGYPWFTDWGRDTMISLPGLATALGRYDVAAGILRTYASFVDRGMLPNCFPDGGEPPQYNTADATLWMFHAFDDYLQANPDPDLVRELFPIVMTIIHAHSDGTRYGIRVDPADGLLYAGEHGTQLTWMDGAGCSDPLPGLTIVCTAMRRWRSPFLGSACLGTISEIFDGDAPHQARGCFAQAWSVAEILRSWIYLERKTLERS